MATQKGLVAYTAPDDLVHLHPGRANSPNSDAHSLQKDKQTLCDSRTHIRTDQCRYCICLRSFRLLPSVEAMSTLQTAYVSLPPPPPNGLQRRARVAARRGERQRNSGQLRCAATLGACYQYSVWALLCVQKTTMWCAYARVSFGNCIAANF